MARVSYPTEAAAHIERVIHLVPDELTLPRMSAAPCLFRPTLDRAACFFPRC